MLLPDIERMFAWMFCVHHPSESGTRSSATRTADSIVRMIMGNRERCLRQPSQQSSPPDQGCGDPDKVPAIVPSGTAATEALLSPSVTRRLIAEFATRAKRPHHPAGLEELTDREREVLTLVGNGLSNHEIAKRLYVSPATAKTHVSRAMIKLRARDRAQLVVIAYESGLVHPGWRS